MEKEINDRGKSLGSPADSAGRPEPQGRVERRRVRRVQVPQGRGYKGRACAVQELRASRLAREEHASRRRGTTGRHKFSEKLGEEARLLRHRGAVDGISVQDTRKYGK